MWDSEENDSFIEPEYQGSVMFTNKLDLEGKAYRLESEEIYKETSIIISDWLSSL